MEKKRTYRIRNWAEYNKSLIQRGDITVWFSDDAREKWIAKATGARGRPQIYSDDAILCALMVKAVYHKPLRALVGFLRSLLLLLGISLPIPSYTGSTSKTLDISRRRPQFLPALAAPKQLNLKSLAMQAGKN